MFFPGPRPQEGGGGVEVTPRFKRSFFLFVMIMRGGLCRSVTVREGGEEESHVHSRPCHCRAPSASLKRVLERMIGSCDQMGIPNSV